MSAGRNARIAGHRDSREKARLPWKMKSVGQAERERRRTFREAVTASDGQKAVTKGASENLRHLQQSVFYQKPSATSSG